MSDAEMVFTMMDDGDGNISVEELLTGFARLRGTAKSVDLCHLMNMFSRLEKRFYSVFPRNSDFPSLSIDTGCGSDRSTQNIFNSKRLGSVLSGTARLTQPRYDSEKKPR